MVGTLKKPLHREWAVWYLCNWGTLSGQPSNSKMGYISLVCNSRATFSKHQAVMKSCITKGSPAMLEALSISRWISSSPSTQLPKAQMILVNLGTKTVFLFWKTRKWLTIPGLNILYLQISLSTEKRESIFRDLKQFLFLCSPVHQFPLCLPLPYVPSLYVCVCLLMWPLFFTLIPINHPSSPPCLLTASYSII